MRHSTDASTCFFAGIALWVLHSALNKQTLITFPKGLHPGFPPTHNYAGGVMPSAS